MEHIHGMFPLSMLVLNFNLAHSEAEAKVAILNGLVKVNGVKELNPTSRYSLARLSEVQCGKHVIQLSRKIGC